MTTFRGSWMRYVIPILPSLFDVVLRTLMQGKHRIHIDHDTLGPTCGLLPIGVDSTLLTTTGLRWNLGE